MRYLRPCCTPDDSRRQRLKLADSPADVPRMFPRSLAPTALVAVLLLLSGVPAAADPATPPPGLADLALPQPVPVAAAAVPPPAAPAELDEAPVRELWVSVPEPLVSQRHHDRIFGSGAVRRASDAMLGAGLSVGTALTDGVNADLSWRMLRNVSDLDRYEYERHVFGLYFELELPEIPGLR